MAGPTAVGVYVVAAAVTVAEAVVVVAVSGGTGGRGSCRCGTDRRSAIRIIPTTIGNPTTIGSPTIGPPAIGHATARYANSTTSGTCRPNPSSASTDAATAVSERVIGYKGHARKEDGRKSKGNISQHWCSPSLTIADGEQRGLAINEVNSARRSPAETRRALGRVEE
jgi:hypothetical protein